MNRRQLIAAAPAVVAFPATAVQSETPIMQKFRKWASQHEYIHREDIQKLPECEFDVLCDEMNTTEGQIEAEPAQTARDIIAKMLVLTAFGDFYIREEHEFWKEARTFVEADA